MGGMGGGEGYTGVRCGNMRESGHMGNMGTDWIDLVPNLHTSLPPI
jgi:hypothetical protein